MSIYAGIALDTLRAWLTEAQQALPALTVGNQLVSLGRGDQRLTFTPADPDKLRRHIAELQRDIAAAEAAGSATALMAAPRRPIFPWC